MVIIEEVKELFTVELHAIIGDDGIWDPEAMNNIGKEEHHLLRLDSRNWSSFNPLRELVNGDKQVGEAPRRFLEQPNKV
jgi:hypothetical protein